MLKKLRGKAKKVAEVLMLISMFAAGEGMISKVHAKEKPLTTITQKEQEAKKNTLARGSFSANCSC